MRNLSEALKVTISGFFVVLLLMLIACGNGNVKEKKLIKVSDTVKVEFPYRTINAPDSNSYLIAYEFHTGNSDDSRYLECSAVIKSIDPTKDDYKTICRSVVADIIKTTGTDNIAIYIYDNYEAYTLAELKYGQQFKVLNKTETDTVELHRVADYYGKMRESESQDNHTLRFYSQANNRFTEKEVYEPSVLERDAKSYAN